jgi:antitoxin component HigA of HigAB toxin-antitoxin module
MASPANHQIIFEQLVKTNEQLDKAIETLTEVVDTNKSNGTCDKVRKKLKSKLKEFAQAYSNL